MTLGSHAMTVTVTFVENTQFNHPIAVDRQTVDTLRQKVSTLESQILTLSLGDDKAVRLYR